MTFADRQTCADLEIFDGRRGGPSVFDVVNRTRTRIGALRLRERLGTPGSDPRMIESALRSFRFLADHGFRFTIDPSRVLAVEAYLDSNLTSLGDHGMRAGWIETAWISLRHPDLLVVAREGVGSTRYLVASIRQLCGEIQRANPPSELSAIIGNVVGLLDKLRLERLWVSERSRSLLLADHELRVRHRGDLLRLLRLVGDLDVLLSGAVLIAEGYEVPEVAAGDGKLVAESEGVWHPFVKDPAPNPLRLHADRSLIFLTGPNMAGKTTYLRTIGICLYLAHCGLPVPARRFRFVPMEALFVTLSPEDDVREGVSYFKAELLRMQTVLRAVAEGRRIVAIFDEVFRGTNVHDAREAAEAVISACAGASGCAFVFSSHLSELAETLGRLPTVSLLYFTGELRDGRAAFDFELRPGASSRRLGLHLFREEGLDTLLERIRESRQARPAEGGTAGPG